RGRPQIVELAVIAGQDNKGVRLIVNETPYTGQAQAGQLVTGIDNGSIVFAPIVTGPNSFVLADRLSYCRFSYLVPSAQPPFHFWSPAWPRGDVLPSAIRLEMEPLDHTPSELHMTTVTVPMNVTRLPFIVYTDAQ
ncbi:MAG: hypothetical protein KGN84_15670, partial [Acidobacteriota bacterium]|nr:hypothetical protein [Acidobacteriota bacterium]